jgi:hypothetical protein
MWLAFHPTYLAYRFATFKVAKNDASTTHRPRAFARCRMPTISGADLQGHGRLFGEKVEPGTREGHGTQ